MGKISKSSKLGWSFILVRRVMKTLLYSITSKPWYERLELLRQGLSANVVVNIELTINSRDGSPVQLRFHTVAPRTCNKLGYIEGYRELTFERRLLRFVEEGFFLYFVKIKIASKMNV